MKKVFTNVLSFFSGLAIGSVIVGKKINDIVEIKQNEKEKFRIMYQMLEKWMRIKQKGKKINSYFEMYGYKKIAVYGVGDVGKLLISELKNTGIEVEYGIDKNLAGNNSDITIISPEDSLPQVDAVVVTAIAYFDDINNMLENKVKCPIISLEDIIYEMV